MTTQEKKDKVADARLQKLYGIGLSWYDAQFKKQGGKCACCGATPKNNKRFFIDHNHRVEKEKLITTKIGIEFQVRAANSLDYVFCSRDKKSAIRMAKNTLKRRSLRGLLCFKCNKLVLGRLERVGIKPQMVIDYLRKYDPQNPLIKES